VQTASLREMSAVASSEATNEDQGLNFEAVTSGRHKGRACSLALPTAPTFRQHPTSAGAGGRSYLVYRHVSPLVGPTGRGAGPMKPDTVPKIGTQAQSKPNVVESHLMKDCRAVAQSLN
jgi:hypothetical protein